MPGTGSSIGGPMFIKVNGAKLFFDVEGASLVSDGPTMKAKPTLLLLHGGPGIVSVGIRSLQLQTSLLGTNRYRADHLPRPPRERAKRWR
jgi:hypothetical protein